MLQKHPPDREDITSPSSALVTRSLSYVFCASPLSVSISACIPFSTYLLLHYIEPHQLTISLPIFCTYFFTPSLYHPYLPSLTLKDSCCTLYRNTKDYTVFSHPALKVLQIGLLFPVTKGLPLPTYCHRRTHIPFRSPSTYPHIILLHPPTYIQLPSLVDIAISYSEPHRTFQHPHLDFPGMLLVPITLLLFRIPLSPNCALYK